MRTDLTCCSAHAFRVSALFMCYPTRACLLVILHVPCIPDSPRDVGLQLNARRLSVRSVLGSSDAPQLGDLGGLERLIGTTSWAWAQIRYHIISLIHKISLPHRYVSLRFIPLECSIASALSCIQHLAVPLDDQRRAVCTISTGRPSCRFPVQTRWCITLARTVVRLHLDVVAVNNMLGAVRAVMPPGRHQFEPRAFGISISGFHRAAAARSSGALVCIVVGAGFESSQPR